MVDRDQFVSLLDASSFKQFLLRTIQTNFCSEIEFRIVSLNDDELSSADIRQGKKQVKFKLGLVTDRLSLPSLDGPLIQFHKLIGQTRFKEPDPSNSADASIEQLMDLNFFSKEICRWQNPSSSNFYQQSNYSSTRSALELCLEQYTSVETNFDLDLKVQTCRHLTNLIRVCCFTQNGHLLLRSESMGLGREDLVRLASFISRLELINAHLRFANIDEDQSVHQALRFCSLKSGLKQKNLLLLVRLSLLSPAMIDQIGVFTRESFYPGLFTNEELIRIAVSLSPGLPTTRRVNKTNSVLKTFFSRVKKRLHLVILDDESRPLHETLSDSCFIDIYKTWSQQDIEDIVRRWIDKHSVS